MFVDRREAGRRLATRLKLMGVSASALVLAVPRGGVPVARPIADALGAELDLWLVRKLGVPGYRELAMGAVALGGTRVVNRGVLAALGLAGLELVERVAAREAQEIERQSLAYRGTTEPPRVEGREVILVDDGVATGASMRAAVEALRKAGARRVVVAVPVGAPESLVDLGQVADEVVYEAMPESFMAVGQWYRDFRAVSDDEVRALLVGARASTHAAASLG